VDFNSYQNMAGKTDLMSGKYDGERPLLYPVWVYYVLGMCSEAGEVSDKVKKFFRDGDVDPGEYDALVREVSIELGDVLWYIARLADAMGVELDDVASANLKKLSDRMDRGKLRGSGDER